MVIIILIVYTVNKENKIIDYKDIWLTKYITTKL